MAYRSPVRVSTVAAVVTLVALAIAACGDTSGSSFPEGDGGKEGGTGPNSASGSFTQDGQAPGDDDDDLDGGCVGDVCRTMPTSVCGDGKVDAPEQCDDANPKPGDGCSGTCQIEPGYTCPTAGQDCIYTVATTCGNGKIEGNEACDDANAKDNDGCSAGCQVEPGWSCSTPGQPCVENPKPACGDGAVDFGEECDDKNVAPSDGCSADCKIEPGYTCPTPGQLCGKLEYCGDGILQTANGEDCDDKNAVPGDGCSGVCLMEPGYACPAPGNPCTKIWVCGNGKVDPGETCDDSGTVGGDGCTADCLQVEAGYTCPATGGPCSKAATNVCGDAIIAGAEQCDDGGAVDGDGCSKTCGVEPGYTCPTAGQKCTKIAFCGDGKIDLALGEECDDGVNPPVSGDGCTSTCKLEPNFVCPTPGAKCVSTVVCGDKKVTGSETCDDGNKLSNDGCSSTCLVEAGWKCVVVGIPCTPKQCGDGKKVGDEQCDDGNTINSDGCDSNCRLESKITTNAGDTTTPPSTSIAYYDCKYIPAGAAKQTCGVTTCGNGPAPDSPEGSEQCDDGNLKAYDGCSPLCTLEPKCPNGTCVARCGDGLLFNFDGDGDGKIDEACDDNNTQDGDGCSSTCQVEAGYTCSNSAGTFPTFIDIPVVFRDFRFGGDTASAGPPALPAGHPDFNTYGCSDVSTDLVKPNLSAGLRGVPVFNKVDGTTGCTGQLTSAADFDEWYKDGTRASRIDGKQLRLQRNGVAGDYSYVFDSANDEPWKTKGGFFPIDGLGWGDEGTGSGGVHNFAFTSELRYWFTYDKSKSPDLAFSGDDDVWVFINGKLALDVGGLHPRQDRQFTLDNTLATNLGLVDGHLYEIALFHAERHTDQSNFKLTLRGFVKNTSVCKNVCGDGIRTREEQCDLGSGPTGNKTPAPYGGCTTACLLGPYCGDTTTTNPPETCDDGVNQTTYGGQSKKCGPGCTFAPYCGDAKVSNGEQCDNGTALNVGGYGKCTSTCTFGPKCGDGIKDSPQEQCDHGISNGASADSCNADCTLRCGDGVKQPGEECDDGAVNNVGGYGKCKPDCTLGPRCGDGIQTGAEQCDDGKNDGTYGTCKNDCTLANYCGDSILTNPPEVCDQGAANSATAYGAGKCSNRCTPAPKCGDKAVDGPNGETCDDGKNDGSPGSCTTDCKSFVPNPTCGNGAPDPGEQCDNGSANNGKPGNACDSHCRFTCGNGVKDSGETCDNGVNDGSYGGCTTNCQIASYCGDGIKNGPEQCDNSSSNQPVGTAYGPGICTQACTFAGYCGDGRIQSSHGEQCDGTSTCDSACKLSGPK